LAFSRPGPGPLTNKSTSCTPSACAALIACSAASRAAKGVLLREPLKPAEPAEPQAMVLPSESVTVTIVLLKEAKICIPCVRRLRIPHGVRSEGERHEVRDEEEQDHAEDGDHVLPGEEEGQDDEDHDLDRLHEVAARAQAAQPEATMALPEEQLHLLDRVH